jgi:hypothetical protein
MTDRIALKERVNKMIAHGYATHRVQQKILIEMSFEIIDTIFDELEAQGILKKPIKREAA